MYHTQPQTIGDKDLYEFLVNAPKVFRESERIRKFQLKNGDYIHCVLWNYHFYITGTDIVKILIWRFQNAGRQIGAIKKFEEGIFSDLRNLKPGIDATLEGPRSEFLEFLYKNGCIRTQKKQKVFYWYSVPHDALFCDALERDMRRDTSLYAYGTYLKDPRRMFLQNGSRGYAKPNIYGMPKNIGLGKMEYQGKNAGIGTMEYPIETQTMTNIEPIRKDLLNLYNDILPIDAQIDSINTPENDISAPLPTKEVLWNTSEESLFKENRSYIGENPMENIENDLFGYLGVEKKKNTVSSDPNIKIDPAGSANTQYRREEYVDMFEFPTETPGNTRSSKADLFEEFNLIGSNKSRSEEDRNLNIDSDCSPFNIQKKIEEKKEYSYFDLEQFSFLKERVLGRKNIDGYENTLADSDLKFDNIVPDFLDTNPSRGH